MYGIRLWCITMAFSFSALCRETYWKQIISIAIVYTQTSNISRSLVGNNIVDHSDVVGASPIGVAPTTSSFSTIRLASIDWTKTTTRRDEIHSNLGIWCVYTRGFTAQHYKYHSINTTIVIQQCTMAAHSLSRSYDIGHVHLVQASPVIKWSYCFKSPIVKSHCYWGRDKMAAVSQTTLSNAFSSIKMLEFRLRFHLSLFLTIIQHWFR